MVELSDRGDEREAKVVVAGAPAGTDLGALARWLGERGEQVTGPLTVRRIGLGQSNLTYRVDDANGHCWVVRRPRTAPCCPPPMTSGANTASWRPSPAPRSPYPPWSACATTTACTTW